MNWQRLDRDTTLKTIDSVKSVSEAALFSPATSEVQRARLTFYDSLSLYKITNFASLPSFTFEYIGDGRFFHYLDGTEQPIYAANDKGELSLNDRTVVDYLEFFLGHVMLEDDEMVFIRDARDMPLLDSLDPDSAYILEKNHKPPQVSYDAGFDRYTVEADLYSEGQMLRAIIEVSPSGRVSITSRKMIVNAVGSGIMA
jgi:hypothetical protein